MSRAHPVRTALALLLLAATGCTDDASQPSAGEASVVMTGLDRTLLGAGGRRGTLTADTALFGERLGTVRLLRPVLRLEASDDHPQPFEVAADSGTLDVATEIVHLVRPRRVAGAPTALLNADTVGYDPACDSVWAVPGGRIR